MAECKDLSGRSRISYNSKKPEALLLNFDELKTQASVALSKPCIRVKTVTGGSNHELFVLYFMASSAINHTAQDTPTEWSCIARFPREDSEKTIDMFTSELETMHYVGLNTSIPVPKVYYYNFDSSPMNKVGAPFVLMEQMPGRHLYDIWDNQSTSVEHKKSIVTQLAGVLAQLASLKFDKIGSLQKYGVGPLLDPCYESKSEGPFGSMLEYLVSYMPGEEGIGENIPLKTLFSQIKEHLESYFITHKDEPYLQAPYRLIHANFDGPNMLFVEDGKGPPQLSGIIDWEYAYTGPLYNLYEYPAFIQDCAMHPECYAENVLLRAHFTCVLQQQFPRDPAEALAALLCMRSKCHVLNRFPAVFMYSGINGVLEAQRYLQEMRAGSTKAYAWS